ncbi:MAG TPA: alpha/beta hydrolase-fold protein [Chitinophagaceae bacterium]|nr:alpha/beta hydrolase-fold protein [Chitinophagaceae bacterium]
MKCFILVFIIASFSVQFCNAQSKPPTSITAKPFILGEIIELHSKVLNEKRTLNIYLPEGYKKGDSTRYPVIYLLDGSANEDFIHIAGLAQFNNFEWVGRLPKSIVVGIASVDRRRDFTFPTTIEADKKAYPTTGHATAFIDFLEKELQPFINTNYSTSGSATIIGQSLGGLLATQVLFTRPQLFDTYIIVSPSLWWNNGSLLQQDLPAPGKSPKHKTIYIGVGKEGLTPTAAPRVMIVDASLLAEKVEKWQGPNARVYFDYLPEENHGTILHQAVANAFKLFYGSKQPQ